jgi:hypothetical protein
MVINEKARGKYASLFSHGRAIMSMGKMSFSF